MQVVGRAEEVQRVCQILARRRKNNPLLLGEAGVGKTAVAEGLARLIATNGAIAGVPLPDWLQVLPRSPCRPPPCLPHPSQRVLL